MARPNKQGLDYFPLDVDFFQDPKIELVAARFGEKGEIITVKLLCLIYRNGYYLEWNDDMALLFSKRAGNDISSSLANSVVNDLARRGFFDESLLSSLSILTSKGIQNRFLNVVRERISVEIIEDYWLLDLPNNKKNTKFSIVSLGNSVNPAGNSVNPAGNTQRKEKEIKEKNKKTSCPGCAGREKDSDAEKQPKRVYDHDSKHYKAALWLKNKVLVNTPRKMKSPTEVTLQNWADSFRLMETSDKLPWAEIRATLMWAVDDVFWMSIILSADGFRKNYNKIVAKMGAADTADSYKAQDEPKSTGFADLTEILAKQEAEWATENGKVP